jgi:hypothetical protein
MKLGTNLLALFFSSILTGTANAGVILDTPILGGSLLVATDGDVSAQFTGSIAGYFNTIVLDLGELGDDPADVEVFNKYSSVNSILDLGIFRAGTELIFRIDVLNTGLSFFSGDSSRNPDGLAHVEAITTLENGIYFTTIGFEDLLGGGDKDYNDIGIRLTNVLDPPPGTGIPEPSVLLLMLCGIIGLVVQRRRDNLAFAAAS